MMNFRTIKSNVETILGNAAAGRFVVVGYQQQKTSAKEAKGNNRIVRFYYKNGDFPKDKGSLNGPVNHDMDFTIELTCSSSAKVDVATLNNEASTPAQKAAALIGLKEASQEADESIDELWEIVYQILMDARNIDLGSSFNVANRWIQNFRKDDTLDDGELVVITGLASLTCSIDEQVTGDTPVAGDKVFDVTVPVSYDDTGAGISDAGVIVDQAAAVVDPDLVLLLNLNGSDGSTTIVDETGRHTVTAIDNAQLDTAQKKFGTASLLLDDVTDRLDVPDSTDFHFGSGDATIDFFIRWNTTERFATALGQWYASTQKKWLLQTDFGADNRWKFWINGSLEFTSDAFAVSTATWYHFAFVISSGTLTAYRDGIGIGSSAISAIDAGIDDLQIGGDTGNANQTLDGWMDSIRITKRARPSSEFPPTSEPTIFI
jgi:hypothetical protein